MFFFLFIACHTKSAGESLEELKKRCGNTELLVAHFLTTFRVGQNVLKDPFIPWRKRRAAVFFLKRRGLEEEGWSICCLEHGLASEHGVVLKVRCLNFTRLLLAFVNTVNGPVRQQNEVSCLNQDKGLEVNRIRSKEGQIESTQASITGILRIALKGKF